MAIHIGKIIKDTLKSREIDVMEAIKSLDTKVSLIDEKLKAKTDKKK